MSSKIKNNQKTPVWRNEEHSFRRVTNMSCEESPILPSAAIALNDNDVICGRGGVINAHPGNEQFLRSVKRRKPAYVAARYKCEKHCIASAIIEEIHNLDPPGRFLMKDPKNSKVWRIMEDKRALEKTKQALRDADRCPQKVAIEAPQFSDEATVHVAKPSKGNSLGLFLQEDPHGLGVRVTWLSPHSPCHGTHVKVGALIRSINGRTCATVAEAMLLFRRAVGAVVIVVAQPHAPATSEDITDRAAAAATQRDEVTATAAPSKLSSASAGPWGTVLPGSRSIGQIRSVGRSGGAKPLASPRAEIPASRHWLGYSVSPNGGFVAQMPDKLH